MTRRLKEICLTLAVGVALSAVLASAASAEFTTGADSTNLTAEGVSETQKFVITNGTEVDGESSCNEVSIANGGEGLGTAEESITIEPEYGGDCTLSIGESTFEAKVDTNGCHYLLTAHTEEAVHIICSNEEETEAEGESIEITAKILGSFRECFKIHAQTPTEPVIHYINTADPESGKQNVLMTIAVKGITYERVGLCKGEVNESNDADYEGEIAVSGHDGEGEAVDVGVDIGGLTGEALGSQRVVVAGGEAQCAEVSLENATAESWEVTSFGAEPAYGGCTFKEGGSTFEAEVDSNGCRYTFAESEEMSLACPEGSELKVTAFAGGSFKECLKISTQTPTDPAVVYRNRSGESEVMDFEVRLKVGGLTYERVGVCAKEEGNEGNDGTMTGNITVTGDDDSGSPKDVTIVEAGEATLTAQATTSQSFAISGGGEVKCEAASFDSTVTAPPHAEVDAEITYAECTLVEGGSTLETKLDMNGCHYLYTEAGEEQITCPAEQELEATIYLAGAFRECLALPAQTPTSPAVSYDDGTNSGTGKMDFEIASEVEGITYERVGICQEAEGNEKNNMSATGSIKVTGDDEEEAPVDITW